MSIRIIIGDMRVRLRELDDASIDSCVTDPPYHLTSIVKRFGAANAAAVKPGKTGAYARASKGFMGQTWDGGDVAFQPETWAEVLRVLKPGAHLLAFSGTRTYHRMVCAIEDAGFEIRDQIAWIYGSGFPKSHDVSKGIDRHNGDARPIIGLAKGAGSSNTDSLGEFHSEYHVSSAASAASAAWEGWGTALKPALEPIALARKPLIGTIAANVLCHGTGALNIDGCRVDSERPTGWSGAGAGGNTWNDGNMGLGKDGEPRPVDGRWPANVIHDGSDEVVEGFPHTTSGTKSAHHIRTTSKTKNTFGERAAPDGETWDGDSGSAARFFYSAKADSEERHMGCADLDKRNSHPTVKPLDLMRYLCRLITPAGGTVLDPFAGSGSTLIAADMEQFNAIGCELSDEYAAIALRRINASAGMFAEASAA